MTSKKKTKTSSKKSARKNKVSCEESVEGWRYQNALALVCSLLMITALSAKAWFHSSLGKQT